MELAIEAGEISPLVYLGRLYVFWTQVEQREITRINEARSESGGYVFKVYAKYSYLDEHGKWSAPQKVYIGYRWIADTKIYEWSAPVPTTTDAQKTAAVERFQEEVFRKPYPIIQNGRLDAPIKLYYIWSDDKTEQPLEGVGDRTDRYITEEYNKHETVQWQIWDSESNDCLRQSIRLHISLAPTTFFVVNWFPASNSIEYELNNQRQGGTLVLDNANAREATMEIALHDLLGTDELCPNTAPPPTSISITVGVQHVRGPNGSGGFTSYAPKVSCHDLSLATTTINGAGEINMEDVTSTEFLRKEYEEAKKRDVQAGYVQDGTQHFTDTDKGRIVSQYPENRAELTLPEQQYILLSTILVDELSQRIFAEEITEFLSLETQCLPDDSPGELDFDGPYGTYYQELFFHIPFLIAHHLNANQKFKEAKWWYERIFDPTAPESPNQRQPTDRYWRYRKFRIGTDEAITRLKDVLVQPAAIEEYKRDPFNPHAIARLRPSAYQKAIVMRYIDNLLDWGDYLFAQDSMESINEATMLYVLAADILGKRPMKLGKCDAPKDWNLTYTQIGPCIDKDADFLIVLENWILAMSTAATATRFINLSNVHSASNNASRADVIAGGTSRSTAFAITGNIRESNGNLVYALTPYGEAAKAKARYADVGYARNKLKTASIYPNAGLGGQVTVVVEHVVVFCAPPNYDLLEYWDRVEDRLFKIRHCMNISGVRRQLALFQPPINPALLVRARAAGLSLEDILAMLAAPLPPYRFSYLIEKAKQFTQTVQSFGNTLLSALEKKDVEELTLLRSVHERNILRMTKEIKMQQCKEAQHQYQAMVETKTNVQNRINYYQDLIEDGLTTWETTQQVSKHTATGLRLAESCLPYS